MDSNFCFKPRAQLLLQLGDQLIKNESVALLELVKNSYDADASQVIITLNNLDDKEKGFIEIIDDGIGMDRFVIENIWFELGNTHKKNDIVNNIRTKKGRLPIGEKGIGRLGIHKLGKNITIVTKSNDSPELVITIDWETIEKVDYLDELFFNVVEREPVIFKEDKTGTLIQITNLRNEWKETGFRNVVREINNMCSPFKTVDGFSTKINTNMKKWKTDAISFNDIKKFALFHFTALFNETGNMDYEYKFIPYEGMNGVAIEKRNGSAFAVNSKNEPLVTLENDKSINIGEFSLELYIFDRDTEVLTQYLGQEKKMVRDYLDENGGIYVFRDGLRVYDYGEKGNDWLSLDSQRVNDPSRRISNNIVLGSVELNRFGSSGLVEKTNREGFIDNEAYRVLISLVKFGIEKCITFRNIDKEKYKSIKPYKDNLQISLNQLRTEVNKLDITDDEKNKLNAYIQKVGNHVEYIQKISLTTASVGMSYGVVIHEMEKIVKELYVSVQNKADISDITIKVEYLNKIIENYSEILRKKERKVNSIKEIIDRAKQNCSYRFDVHNIEFFNGVNAENSFNVLCNKPLIVASIMNLFDNSIWWLEKRYKEISKSDDPSNQYHKIIGVYYTQYLPDYDTILIIDNGTGFSILPEDAIKPFVTDKPGGMGVGLNIVNEIMESNNGKLVFPKKQDIVDVDFSNINPKSIVGLAFKKDKK